MLSKTEIRDKQRENDRDALRCYRERMKRNGSVDGDCDGEVFNEHWFPFIVFAAWAAINIWLAWIIVSWLIS